MARLVDPLLLMKRSRVITKVGACPGCDRTITFKKNTLSCICDCGKYLKKEDLVEPKERKSGPYIAIGFNKWYTEDPVHGVMTKEQAERHKRAESVSGRKRGAGH